MRENGIASERLLLRELREEDWQAVHEYASDPEVVRFVDFGPNTEEETRGFIGRAIDAAKCEPRTAHDLVIVLKESGEIIGGCGIHVTKPEHREACIGYVLSRGYWGLGLATETACALLEYGFEILGLRRIFAVCDVENPASARVMENAGMRREGLLRENALVKGRYRDELMYAILDHEWRTMSERRNNAHSESLRVRQGERGDAANLLGLFADVDTLHRKALPMMYRDPPGNVRGQDFFDPLFADENATLLVAESSGRIVGFVLVRIRERPSIPIIVPGRYAVIEDVVVERGWRRRGVGRDLIKGAEEWAIARGITLMELLVWEFNSDAIRFYDALGYENANRRMWKRLSG